MSVTATVSISKKIGLPDYGSLGASCSVQFEVDSNSLQREPTAFQQAVQNAYRVVSQAVSDELARQQDQSVPSAVQTAVPTRSATNGNHGHGASEKQLSYARQLAGQIDGLGVRRLESIAQKMFGKPVAGLTTLDASGLIDVLKDLKAGKIDVAATLNGAAT
ncbi:MAG: hypothetical protein K8T91_10805 [Planctomycetes bacterium]|nr:hypothetical protein [Planctomycetota bacterium]